MTVAIAPSGSLLVCAPQQITLNAVVSNPSSCVTQGESDCNHSVANSGGWLESTPSAALCGDNAGAKLWTAGNQGTSFITIDLGEVKPAGTEICARMKLEHCNGTSASNSSAKIQGSLVSSSGFFTINSAVTFSSTNFQEFCYTLGSSARFIKVSDNGSCSLRLDYVKATTAPSNSNAVIYAWSGPGIVGSTNLTSVSVNQAGNYQVSVTDCTGCVAVNSVEVGTSCSPDEICEITGYESLTGRSFYLPPYGTDFRASVAFGGLHFAKYSNGTAHMYGVVERISNSNHRFEVSLWFFNQSTYAQWISQGRQPHTPQLGDETTWIFYDFSLTNSNTLIGQGSLAGVNLNLANQSPAYGLQLGNGANALNSNANGISAWFSFTGTSSGNGDVNASYNCTPDCGLTVDAGDPQQVCIPQEATLIASVTDVNECEEPGVSDCNHPIAASGGWLESIPSAGVCGDNAGAKLWTSGNNGTSFITLDLGSSLPAGTEICVRMKLEHCSGTSSSNSSAKIQASTNSGSGFVTLASAVTFSQTSYQDFCYTLGSAARYIKVSDNGSCSFRLDYVRSTTPAISGNEIIYNWSGPGIVGSNSGATITVNAPGTYTVVVTDCTGCSANDYVIVTGDVTPPVFDDQETHYSLNCGASIPLIQPTATDNGGSVFYAYTDIQTCLNAGVACQCTHIREWTATDLCDNVAVFLQHFVITDLTAPVIISQTPNQTIECGNAIPEVVVVFEDNCDNNLQIVVDEEVVNQTCGYVYTKTCTATDNCGNTVTATTVFTVIDTTDPVVSEEPTDLTIECGDDTPEVSVSFSDACDQNLTITVTTLLQPYGCTYKFYRTITATDDCDNSTTVDQYIYVVDTTDPILNNIPANATIECNEVIPGGVVFATDNCDENMTVSMTAVTEQLLCGYRLVRTWSVSDDCGNSATASQITTVVDTQAPTITYAPVLEVTLQCNEPIPFDMPQFADICDNELAISVTSAIENVSACGYDLVQVWTATDDCDNSTPVTQRIHFVDTINPVLFGVPNDLTVNCNAIPGIATSVFATDNCGAANVAVAESATTGCPYIITRTWTATDACGNQVSDSQEITVVDNVDPVFTTIVSDATAECDNIPSAPSVTAVDACDASVTITFSENVTSGTCTYYIYRTWTAVDDCGNDAVLNQTITVVDTTDPILAGVPSDMIAECEAVPVPALVTATDNCTDELIVSLVENIIPQTCGYSIERIWSVSDDCGNTASATQMITVLDTIDPELQNVPSDISLECNSEIPAANVTATDNCDETITVQVSLQEIELECGYQIIRTWTVADECGNSASDSQTLTFIDTVDPIITGVPADDTVECDNVPAAVTSVTASDSCSEVGLVFNETIVLGDPVVIGGPACGYTIYRTWTATDICENSVSATQVITVIDTEAPSLIGVPADETVECDAIPTPAIVFAVDNCYEGEMAVVYSFDIIPGDGCTYQIVRTWTVQDNCANQNSLSQTITVIDTQVPVLLGVPANTTVECDAVMAPAIVTATDNCDEQVDIAFTEAQTEGCNYQITRTWVATDNCGLQTTAVQVINVVDTTAPVMTGVPANETVECGDAISDTIVNASDNCDSAPVVNLAAVTIEQECGYILLRTWTATDNCGNESVLSQTITVVDTLDPNVEFAPEAELTVECGDEIPEVTPEFSDICDLELTLTSTSGIANVTACGYDIERSWTATDDCENSTTVYQVIHVVDTESPAVVFAPAIELTVECSDPIPFEAPVFTDICDTELTISVISGIANVTNCGYDIQRSWIAADDCGNSTTVNQVIHIVDTTNPVLAGVPIDETVECDAVPAPATSVSATDNCSVPFIMFYETISEGCPYVITRTWTATDDCGNSVSDFQVITVVDTHAPELIGVPVNETVECDAIPAPAIVTASDNCDESLEVAFSESTEDQDCGYVIIRNWSTMDDCENVAAATQTITVIDTTDPIWNGMDTEQVVQCDVTPVFVDPIASDNCDLNLTIDFETVETPGSCENSWTLVYRWTATDECGNSAIREFIYHFVDTTAPTFDFVPSSTTVECDAVPAPADLTATDNCAEEVEVNFSQTQTAGCPYTITRVWTAMDYCGNEDVITQEITVLDTQAPVLNGVPVNTSMECTAFLMPAFVSATDNCAQNLPVSLSTVEVDLECGYEIVRTWSATDLCGNTTSESQTVTVVDTQDPFVTSSISNDVTIECTDEYPTDAPEFGDLCDTNLSIEYTAELQGVDACEYLFIRTWTVTDECDNSFTFVQTVHVLDTTAPVLIGVPADDVVECDAIPTPAEVSANDACSTATVSFNETTQVIDVCSYAIIRAWSAVDECGNMISDSQILTVVDTTDPVIVFAPEAEITVECGDAIPSFEPTFSDNCDNDLTYSAISGISNVTACGYDIERAVMATDNCGNAVTASQVVHIVDTVAPTLAGVPADETVECTDIPAAAEVFATDVCDADVDVVFDEVTVPSTCGYGIIRTWSSEDDCGNSVSAQQLITVVDTTDPIVISAPASGTINCDLEVPFEEPVFQDACDLDLDVQFTETINELSCSYQIVREWTATDDCGNSVTVEQSIHVLDTTAPVISGPIQLFNSCDNISTAILVTATDNCDNDVTITFVDIYSSGGCQGVMFRTYTATDNCSNSSTFVQFITLTDSVDPEVVETPTNVTVQCDEEIPSFEPVFTDNCDDELDIQFTSITTDLECGYQITRTWTASDNCDNALTISQVITVEDTVDPILSSMPEDESYQCSVIPEAPIVTVSDNCDSSIELNFVETIVTIECGFTVTRTWSAVDNCGNNVSHTQTIQSADTTDPELFNIPGDLSIECGEALPAPSTAVFATDNCDEQPLIIVADEFFTDACSGYYVRVWRAYDDCGNSAVASQTIDVVDTIAPEFNGSVENIVVNCENVPAPAVLTATDNCDANFEVMFEESSSDGCPYVITRTWTATDACGNDNVLVQEITVIDNADPVFDAFPVFAYVECDAVAGYMITASDNCDSDVVVTVLSELMFSGACYGVLERTYLATDNCGNTALATQIIDIIDSSAPELFNVPGELTIDCEASIPAPSADVFATDNCDSDVTITFSEVQTNDFCPFDIIRTWTAVDDCQNTIEGEQVIHVVADVAPAFNLSVYPNPTSGNFVVEFSNPDAAFINAGIYDVAGKQVSSIMSGPADGGRLYKYAFGPSMFDAGGYVVRVVLGDEVYHQKLIIVK